MAVIQYTAIVNQIRGKLNGSVFNKGKTSYTLQRKQQGKRSQTTAQLRRRANFSSIQRSWKELTINERVTAEHAATLNPVRDRFGNEVVLSGYNHWVKANLIISLLGFSIQKLLQARTAPALPLFFESSTTVFTTLPDGSIRIDSGAILQTVNTNDGTVGLMCYISFPMSQGVTSYSGRWFFIGGQRFPNATVPVPELDIGFSSVSGLNYPVPAPDQKVLIRIDVWNLAIGAMVQRIERETEF